MPELPEVETIRLQLEDKVRGKTIKNVDVRFAKFINVPRAKFEKAVRGAKIKDIRRRAKLLIIDLLGAVPKSEWSLVIHLKLTGQMILQKQPEDGQEEKYAHLIYNFSDSSRLLHRDMRQFGWVKLIKTKDLQEFFKKKAFGPEPLEKDFTLEKFKQLLAKRPKAKIKPLLMDQTFLAGLGNVYSQEVCFFARVLPTRKASTLTEKEISDLYNGLRTILPAAIKYRGSSVDLYVDISGRQGDYLSKLRVYGRSGEKCFRCSGTIKKIKLAGRGTCFCSKCQK